jgi:hypothetical protein
VALPAAAAAVPTAAAKAGSWVNHPRLTTIPLFCALLLLLVLLLLLLLVLLLLLLLLLWLRTAVLAVVAVMFHMECIPFGNHGQCIAAIHKWLHCLVCSAMLRHCCCRCCWCQHINLILPRYMPLHVAPPWAGRCGADVAAALRLGK